MPDSVYLVTCDAPLLEHQLTSGKYVSTASVALLDSLILFTEGEGALIVIRSAGILGGEQTFSKLLYEVTSAGVVPREEFSITREEYYDILLRIPNVAVEQILRMGFTRDEVEYKLDINQERGISILTVSGDDLASAEAALEELTAIDCIEPLSGPAEAEFFRRYLRL